MMGVDHTYVVLKNFTIPDGFCYGYFVNFIITENGPVPENRQNCGFYYLKDGNASDIGFR